MVLIKCSSVQLNYGSNVVVKDFSFDFCSGELVFIVGHNGCGKSTLLRGILGIHSVFDGKIQFVNLKRNELGFLPQKLDLKVDFPASVFEVVLSGFCSKFSFWNFYSSSQKSKVVDVLKYLELDYLKDRSFKELSKGQQQRVLFARSICAAKKILFLDEPCANLDPVFGLKFYEIVRNLNEKSNMAVVMVTHNLNQVKRFTNAVVIHMDKIPVFVGSSVDYFKSDVGMNFFGGLKDC